MLKRIVIVLILVAISSCTNKQNTKVESAPEGAKATDVDGLWLTVNKASGAKCVRCWHHREDVGSHEGHEELCGRCVTNIDGEGEERHYA